MKKLLKFIVLVLMVQVLLELSPNRPFERIPHSRPTPVEQFMDKIAEIESPDDDHTVINRYGMMGRYQFSPQTIRVLGFRVSNQEFLNNPSLQDSVMLTYMWANQKDLEGLIKKLDGSTIKGVRITRASIIAGAHFAGSSNVRRFLTDPSNKGIIDGNGTSLVKYMSRFSDFHLPPIVL